MPRVKVNCYDIPIGLGDHIIYLVSTTSEATATSYIKKKFGVDFTEDLDQGPSGAYFVGELNQLIIYLPPGSHLDLIVHEIVHVYKYMIKRMGTNPDEEGEAYIKQMLFQKILNKLIEVNLVKITYK